jgi:UDP-N-acetylglucosamine--N-acetylmuramyl-(pentapeptide) pyrophosphoryl-undecaprenol N-acetylglucosamine transferase
VRILLTGGGTGGHVYPAIAIARDLMKKVPGCEVMYVGTDKGLEADIVPKEGFNFRTIQVESLPRGLSLKTLRTGYKLIQGFWGARRVLSEFKPEVVIGTGGYVCGPIMLVASLMGIPTVIHEQNALPGITNKLLARFVDTVLVTFPESEKYFPSKSRVIMTGLPVRPGIMNSNRELGAKSLGLDPRKFTLLVTGGSRGARSINLAMVEVLEKLAKRNDIQVIMTTGTQTYEEFMTKVKNKAIRITPNLLITPYLYKMEEALAVADLCVCRAGAAFLSELLVKGKPSILIPYPFAAENHQEYNARAVADKGGAVVILDKELSSKRLYEEIDKLLTDRGALQEMAKRAKKQGKPEALEKISRTILQLKEQRTK